MRLVIQRVSQASVNVQGEITGRIGQGLVILVGITHQDTLENARWLARKVAGLRIFEDRDGKFNFSLRDIGGAALVVSQFTLYGDSRKGRRPSFSHAAPPAIAEPLIAQFSDLLREEGILVETGVFGAHMAVEIHNDGPVTLILDH